MQYYLKWQKTETLEIIWIFNIGGHINKIQSIQTMDIMHKKTKLNLYIFT